MSKRYEVQHLAAAELRWEFDTLVEAQNKLLEIKKGMDSRQEEASLNDLQEGICMDAYYLTVEKMKS